MSVGSMAATGFARIVAERDALRVELAARDRQLEWVLAELRTINAAIESELAPPAPLTEADLEVIARTRSLLASLPAVATRHVERAS